MAGRSEVLNKSFTASGAIPKNRFIKATGTGDAIALATAATDPIIGLSSDTVSAADGEMADGVLLGIGNLQIGGTVTYGGFLTSDATGRGVAATGAVRVGAIAMASGVVNDIIPVLIFHSLGA